MRISNYLSLLFLSACTETDSGSPTERSLVVNAYGPVNLQVAANDEQITSCGLGSECRAQIADGSLVTIDATTPTGEPVEVKWSGIEQCAVSSRCSFAIETDYSDVWAIEQ